MASPDINRPGKFAAICINGSSSQPSSFLPSLTCSASLIHGLLQRWRDQHESEIGNQ